MKLDFSALTFIPGPILRELEEAMDKCEINTPLRAAHFLCQAKEESLNFTHEEELLYYSAERLMAVFPSHFATVEVAKHYAKQPEKIGSRVYAGKGGNGDELSGDGYKFRGRGYFQLTERNNYEAFGKFIGENLLEEPYLVANKYPALSAAWFFQTRGLNHIADEGGADRVVQEITKRINGGLNGITHRIANFKELFPLIKIAEENKNTMA